MIVVIADDLSGAAELAGAAQLRGLTAEVHTRFTSAADAEVICVDTGSRALPASEAGRVIQQVIREVAAVGPAWIYLKFDSVLRGNVLTELRAAMAETRQATALLVTANPSRGRVIRGGNYLVDGIPLHETSFARDPDHPRASASVVELLGADISGVTTPDVEHPEDLAHIAAGADPGTLLAGSVEFFEALLERRVSVQGESATRPLDPGVWPDSEPAHRPVTLLTCGSLASWEIRCREADDRGVQLFELFDDTAGIVRALERDGVALIGIGDSESTRTVAPSALVERLAERTAKVATLVSLDRLLLEGGATAAAVVRQLGWTRLLSLPAGGPGVGALRPVQQGTPTLFIKPGSYPWPGSLW